MLHCNTEANLKAICGRRLRKGDCHGCHHLWRCPALARRNPTSKHYQPLLHRGYGSAAAARLSRNRAPRISVRSQTRLARPLRPTSFAADPAAFTGENRPALPPPGGVVLLFVSLAI